MRKEKQLLLDEISEKVEKSNTLLFARYTKLGAGLVGDFRNRLRDAGGELEMVRKRLLVKAAEAAGFSLDIDQLEGHIAIVAAKGDPVAATKVVFDFGKETETVEVLGGRFDGELLSADQVKKISELPDQQTMRSQFLGLLEAPMAQTLSTMQALLTSILYCLDNKVKESN